eukprot:5970120-Pyramimonas_sp.AAC.1
MLIANETGIPAVRPVFLEFPHDMDAIFAADYHTDGQFMFGPDLLIAPVTRYAQNVTRVYLPRFSSRGQEGGRGATGAARGRSPQWRDHFTGAVYPGGVYVSVDTASLAVFPLFVRSLPQVLKDGELPTMNTLNK